MSTLTRRERAEVAGMLEKRLALEIENARFGDDFVEIEITPEHRARYTQAPLIRACRNRRYLVQVFDDNGHTRITVNRTSLENDNRRWTDGITWDQLMDIKRAVGYGDAWCVEAYPADAAVVNVANMRHLFVLDAPPAWGWNREQGMPDA